MVKYSNTLEQELCSRFLTESTKLPIDHNVLSYRKGLFDDPGIYGIGDEKNIFYIGSSIHVKSRLKQHSGMILQLRSPEDYNKKNLYCYVMYFEDTSPIGKVYAARKITCFNYHENCLIYNLRPFLNVMNKAKPPNELNSSEEKYYRSLIVSQCGIQGFSRYLISALLSRNYSWRERDNEVYRKSQRILESSELLGLIGSFEL